MAKQRIPWQEQISKLLPYNNLTRLLKEIGQLSWVCVTVEFDTLLKTDEIEESQKSNSPESSTLLTMRRFLTCWRCFFANVLSFKIRDFQDLQMHRSCRSIFTGNLHKISSTSSDGRVGSEGDDRVPADVEKRGGMEQQYERNRTVNVRFSCCKN